MDYSNLVTALQENDTKKVNELISALRPRLIAFLRIHMNATQEDAEDCAQDSLLTSIEIINEDRIQNPEQVVSYILSTCRNTYLKMQKKKRPEATDDISDKHQQAPRQLQSLLDKEQKRLLNICMDQLKEKHQSFMQYWFDHPDAQAKKVADHFNISLSNTWTRKHRIIKKLNECYTKKSKL
ncbi:RNA polymerase sigma factor [Fodinibius halophilus]|uniref:Sigma-70 family RNA polymerase sigma factor n=1 Tax=Fodinibius halophilus TaxID=1736908 RepID=A0A6M1T371_9BACT|nr:sigma-70 family RNA polymerase sigma factor [Fodinibius halophilus]NGP87063.1 sigma-70 family RNA polymerase sigma factor [Fodinibius halophilus]